MDAYTLCGVVLNPYIEYFLCGALGGLVYALYIKYFKSDDRNDWVGSKNVFKMILVMGVIGGILSEFFLGIGYQLQAFIVGVTGIAIIKKLVKGVLP